MPAWIWSRGMISACVSTGLAGIALAAGFTLSETADGVIVAEVGFTAGTGFLSPAKLVEVNRQARLRRSKGRKGTAMFIRFDTPLSRAVQFWPAYLDSMRAVQSKFRLLTSTQGRIYES